MSAILADQRSWQALPVDRIQQERLPTVFPPGGQYGQRPSPHGLAALSPSTQRFPQSTSQGFALPPLPAVPPFATDVGYPPSTGRLAGVSSILNHIQPDTMGQNKRRRASDLISPHSSTSTLPPIELSNMTNSGVACVGPSHRVTK